MEFHRINHYFLKTADFLSGQQVMYWYEFYSKAQWWSRERLLEYQNDKLKRLLSIVSQEVPFYRDLFSRNGVDLESIRSADDMHRLPMVTKKALKDNYPHDCTRKTNSQVKEYFTSGSSGNPFATLIDNISMSQARALMILRANYSGWEFGEPVFQTGMSIKRGLIKSLKDLILNTYYASAADLKDETLDKYLELIEKKKIKYLMGYPGSIVALADRARKVGYNYGVKGITTWGDNLYDSYRKKIEDQFKCRITDTYGCGEGIQVAAQCPSGNGLYHIFMPHVIVEIVDDKGYPVKRGERGSIVLTKLEAGAMPLVRYKVGDVGRMCMDGMCNCGSGLDVLEKIEGRETDFVYTPSGNKLIVHFFTGIFEYYPEIDEFRIFQRKLHEIDIHIVARKTIQETVLRKIKNEIHNKGDKNLNINITFVDELECTVNSKRKFIISELNK